MRHCLRWRHGREDDNCQTNTDTVADYLVQKQVETSIPLYVATELAKVDQGRLAKVMCALEAKGYKVRGLHGNVCVTAHKRLCVKGCVCNLHVRHRCTFSACRL